MQRILETIPFTAARMLLTLFAIAFLAVGAQAQTDFADPPKKSSSTKFSKSRKADVKVVQNKANAKNKGKTTRKAARQVEETPTASFYQTEEEATELQDMNDYQLEVKAAAGSTEAQYLLGYRCVFSESVTDLMKGMGWLEKSAKGDHSYAQSLLGYCYYCLDNQEKAGKYYKMSADNNNPIGQYYLGLACANGDCGQTQDFAKALSLYALSGKQGFPEAQYAVGFYLFVGLGTERNISLAERWMRVAADNDNEQAQQFIKNVPFTVAASDELIKRIANEAAVTPTGVAINRQFASDYFLTKLVSVDINATETVFYWQGTSRSDNVFINSDKNTYICVDGSSARYTIKEVRGITMAPETTSFRSAGTTFRFAEVFPAINANAQMLEYHDESGIDIKDIDVRKK